MTAVKDPKDKVRREVSTVRNRDVIGARNIRLRRRLVQVLLPLLLLLLSLLLLLLLLLLSLLLSLLVVLVVLIWAIKSDNLSSTSSA